MLGCSIVQSSLVNEKWRVDSIIISLSLSAGNCCLRLSLVVLVSGLLMRAAHCQGTGAVNGFINFAQTRLVVDEGPATQTFTTVSIPLVREGGTTGNVFVTLTVS